MSNCRTCSRYSRFEGFPHLHRPDPVSPGRVPYTKALHAHRRPRVARAPPKRGAAAAYFAYNLCTCRHRCPHASCTSYFLLHVLDEMLPSLPTQLLLRPQLETRLDDVTMMMARWHTCKDVIMYIFMSLPPCLPLIPCRFCMCISRVYMPVRQGGCTGSELLTRRPGALTRGIRIHCTCRGLLTNSDPVSRGIRYTSRA